MGVAVQQHLDSHKIEEPGDIRALVQSLEWSVFSLQIPDHHRLCQHGGHAIWDVWVAAQNIVFQALDPDCAAYTTSYILYTHTHMLLAD